MLLKLEKLCFLLCLRPSLRICLRARGRASRSASPAAPRARPSSAQHAAPRVPGRSRPVSRALGPWPNSAAHPAHGLLWPPGGLLCSTRSAPLIRIGLCSASFAWNKLHPATGSSNPSIVPLLSRLDRRRPRAAAPWPCHDRALTSPPLPFLFFSRARPTAPRRLSRWRGRAPLSSDRRHATTVAPLAG